MRVRPLIRPVLTLALGVPLLAACGDDGGAAGAAKVAVTASDDACTVASTDLKAGSTTFAVTNKGSKITEVYVYGEQGGRYSKVISEVENVGPGTSRDMTVELAPGSYEVACKPGQTGDGIRTRVTVGGAAGAAATQAESRYDREIEIGATDSALEHADGLTASKGEKIEFKLHNEGTKPRELEVIDPAGKVVAEVEVAAGVEGEVIVELTSSGIWQLKVEGTGVAELTAPVTVS